MIGGAGHRRRLLEHAPCAYIVTTLDGRVKWTNRTFVEWVGDPDLDLTGRSLHDVLTGGGRIRFETVTPALTLNRQVGDVALDIRRTDGSTLNLLCNAVVAPGGDQGDDPGEAETWWVGVDVGARREYERELLVAQRRLGRLQRLSSNLVAATSVGEVADVLLEALVDGVKADSGSVLLSGRTGEGMSVVASRTSVVHDDGAVPAPPDQVIRDAVISRGSATLSTPGDSGEATWHHLGVPLLGGDDVLGVVHFAVCRSAAHAPDESDLLKSAVDIAAQAIDRVQLIERHRWDAERNRSATSLLHQMEEATTLAERAQLVADFVVPLLADFAIVEIPGAHDGPLGLRHCDPTMEPTVRWLLASRTGAATPTQSMVGEVSRSPRLVNDIDAALAARPDLSAEQVRAIRALRPTAYLALPLVARGEVLGTLVLVQTTSQRMFAESDVEFFARVADTCALALDNARLYEHERDVASQLQTAMLPARLPDDPRLALRSFYEAGREAISIGGDWYDAFVLDDGRLALAVGDVVGGGLAAATSMAQLRVALRAYAREGAGVVDVMRRLNRFAATVDGAVACSAVYAELDVDRTMLTFVSAGHPPPVRSRSDAPSDVVWGGRGPLLAVGETPTTPATIELTPGTSVVLYTDGLVERRDRSLDDGIAELVRTLDNHPDSVSDPARLARLMDTATHGDDTCILTVAIGD